MFKAIRKAVKTLARDTHERIKFWFADYCVQDTYGTRRLCWTRKGAMEWLAVCSPNAAIYHMGRNNQMIARREY